MRLYHYLETKWALDNIRRRRLKLSRIDDMNDPYEFACVRSSHQPSQAALDETKRDRCETRGVLCFSRSRNNILMWGHYGDRHKGICLGFDVPDEITRPVTYVGNVTLVGDLESLSDGEKTRIVDLLAGAKYRGWCYEQEVRLHAAREELDEETGIYFGDFGESLRLKEVIAGARFHMSRKPIDEALTGYSEEVKVFKARRSEDKFEIVVDEGGFPPGA
jgi:hypothetical protein